MKPMYYRLIAGIAVAGILSCLPMVQAAQKAENSAPASGKRAQAVRERLKDVKKELNLTPEQTEKLRPILKEAATKAKEVRDDKSLSRTERLQKIKEIRQDLAGKVKEVLTPEQCEKWQQLRQERRSRTAKNR